MRMRSVIKTMGVGLAVVALLAGCGDDASEPARDAGIDGGGQGGRGEGGRLADGGGAGSMGDARVADTGAAGDAAACELEPSYIWAYAECDVVSTARIARRQTLEKYCQDIDCPRDWTAALALAGSCEMDSGVEEDRKSTRL